MPSRFAPTLAALRRAALAVAALAVPLAACSQPYDRDAITSSIPADYHQRHPIVLANAPYRLDVFLVASDGRLDARQAADVRAFALEYRSSGQGEITAMLPAVVDQPSVQKTLTQVRSVLARTGVRGSMLVGRYAVVDPRLAAPIQLSFTKLQANVANQCGQWPDDLASGSSLQTWDNRTYYNFGCATQKDFAMQVADPRDLVRARQEDPSDVNMRLRAIANIEQGLDPGTDWVTNNTTISPVGAN